jgi:predicted alpha/beta superfamily hydrolase
MKLSSFFYATRLIGIPLSIMVSFISLSGQSRFSKAKPDIKEFTIQSKILNQKRKITIYKPPVLPEYAEAVSPVLYVLDGEYFADYFFTLVNYLCERFPGNPPITVVGIENEPSAMDETGNFNRLGRDRDLTPLVANTKDSATFKTSGGADKYLNYIKEEIFPFVEKNYKKPPYRVLAGASLGGFLVMHTFLTHHEMFDAYMAISPAMYINNSAYMKVAEKAINNANERNNRLFISIGNEAKHNVTNAILVDSLLRQKNLKGLSYQFSYYPKEGHASIRTWYDGFHYIFMLDKPSGEKEPSDITYSILENHYLGLSKIYGHTMKPPEKTVNDYGYIFLQGGDTDKALEFFKKNIENYPTSANVYDSYAEALLLKGDKKNAMINYEKAFQMDPTNTAARDIVNKLKSEK